MPAFGLSTTQGEDIAEWLLNAPAPPEKTKPTEPGSRSGSTRTKPSVKNGEALFLTVGCLACHTWRDLGASSWFGGGDLTQIAEKRPPGFFTAWLADPAPAQTR